MITIITGKPGTGKSYSLVRIVKDNLEQGTDVFANFKIDQSKLQLVSKWDVGNIFANIFRAFSKKAPLPSRVKLGNLYYWSDLKEFRDISTAVIVIDEAQSYFSARRWKDMTMEDEIKFQQHRKQGIDIYAGVQNLKRTDTVIRELAAFVIEMKRIGKFIIARRYLPEDIDKATRESLGTKFSRLDLKLAEAYNTNELINLDFEEQAKSRFTKMDTFFREHP